MLVNLKWMKSYQLLSIGDQITETFIRFRNIIDYESYIEAIDQDNESEDVIFNGYFYKITSPQFALINRSEDGNGCDFEHEIVEYRGNICFIPTKGFCFVNCIKFITREENKEKSLDYIGNEKRRSNIMTKARIQPFCGTNNINLG